MTSECCKRPVFDEHTHTTSENALIVRSTCSPSPSIQSLHNAIQELQLYSFLSTSFSFFDTTLSFNVGHQPFEPSFAMSLQSTTCDTVAGSGPRIDDHTDSEVDNIHLYDDPALSNTTADLSFHYEKLSERSSDRDREFPTTSERLDNTRFKRWIKTLGARRRKHVQSPVLCYPRESNDITPSLRSRTSAESVMSTISYASSSSAFVELAKSATISSYQASTISIVRKIPETDDTLYDHYTTVAPSLDLSDDITHVSVDIASANRARKRWKSLEELIRTEEGYVADIASLSHTYLTLLSHKSSPLSYVRSSAQIILAQMLSTHEDILAQMRRVLRRFDHDKSTVLDTTSPERFPHRRWHSLDLMSSSAVGSAEPTRLRPQRSHSSSGFDRITARDNVRQGSLQAVSMVVAIFRSMFPHFGMYEEFGASYDTVWQDIEHVQGDITAWSDYDRAIEAISSTIRPLDSRESDRRRAMTLKDLLIKPIQRIGRYALIFAEMYKATLPCDCPDARSNIDTLLETLRTFGYRMNQAIGNSDSVEALARTRKVINRLTMKGQAVRWKHWQHPGSVVLCGCLHMAFRGKDGISGRYVACILFERSLMIADESQSTSSLDIVVAIPLHQAHVDDANSGRGLQCHTAPHSWKITFSSGSRSYEILFSACSTTEGEVWRHQIECGLQKQRETRASNDILCTGPVQQLGVRTRQNIAASSSARSRGQVSVHRIATVACAADPDHIVIKNTQTCAEVRHADSQPSLSLPRPRSQCSDASARSVILAPLRADRMRLEATMVGIWSHDLLPYPGMAARRIDPIRTSASNVMRKISMASIASTFSAARRSAGFPSLAQGSRTDQGVAQARSNGAGRGVRSENMGPVSFNSNPKAFLPTDFDLSSTAGRRAMQTWRSLSFTIERATTTATPAREQRGTESRQGDDRQAVPRSVGAASSASHAGTRRSGPQSSSETDEHVVVHEDDTEQKTIDGTSKKESGVERLLRLWK